MLEKINRFRKEFAKWVKAGRPFRGKDEVKKIFEICSSNECGKYEKFNENEGKCGECGCRLTAGREVMSKNSWATTRCPLLEPRWIEKDNYINIEITDEETIKIENEQKKEQEKNSPAPKKKGGGCGCGAI